MTPATFRPRVAVVRLPLMARRSIGRFRALGRFFRDPEASKLGKLFVFATLAYVVWPVDLVPDVAPVVGWLDDLGLASVAALYLARVSSRYRSLPEPPTPPVA